MHKQIELSKTIGKLFFFTAQKNETKDEEENEANKSSARLLESIESRKGNGERNGE